MVRYIYGAVNSSADTGAVYGTVGDTVCIRCYKFESNVNSILSNDTGAVYGM